MPFPETPRVIFRHNPLAEVICQLRFPTILEIASQAPSAFQQKIRGRYPLYAFEDPIGSGLPKELSGLLAALPLPKPPDLSVHKFLAEDSRRFISLNREFLALTETNYRRWEEMEAEIEIARAALEEVYKPAFYSRIGLRYHNRIDKDALGLDGEGWDSLLKPPFLGVLEAADVREQVHEIRTEAVIGVTEVPGAFVRLRHGLIRQPPGSMGMYVVDADFYTAERGASEHVVEILGAFKRLAGNLFRWAITPRLHAALEPMEIDGGDSP